MESKSIDCIYWDAAQIASEAECKLYLDRACGGDLELRRRVEQLLQARSKAAAFLESPAVELEATADQLASGERPGTVIGPYTLIEQIGEGGMGVVFMAKQREPMRREVALKVLKPGMDTRQVVARFEAERQALALMDHPNISQIFEGGATASGRPYFVMELVKGIPITDFCDQEQRTVRERLELFLDVCGAVQHAHQKGVIHRDLKPSNVLVTLRDPGTPIVKVIDFGIAKAIGQPLTDKTLVTNFAVLIGTPLYMSPEQAALNGLDVDTRSDIYALGVMLYELLTGRTPFDQDRLRTLGYDEVRRIIREEEPTRPSARISALGQAATTSSTQRQSDPKRMSQLFRGELDWIVMKCLEKDRDRRYETVGALARDIERYFRDEPVQACPPSAAYRFRKFTRRHRAAFVTAILVTAALLLGTVVSAWQAIRATRAVVVARDEADKANAINEFLRKDLLYQASPYSNPVPDRLTLREVLDRAAERAEARFRTQPLIEAALRFTIGQTYTSLGVYDKGQLNSAAALEIYQREKGPGAVETANAMAELGSVLWRKGESSRAEPLLRQATDCLRRALSAGHPDTLHAMNLLANTYRDLGKMADAESL
jgi:non-specific serine/threonine protein kinase/serine/threonine-protein kinase